MIYNRIFGGVLQMQYSPYQERKGASTNLFPFRISNLNERGFEVV